MIIIANASGEAFNDGCQSENEAEKHSALKPKKVGRNDNGNLNDDDRRNACRDKPKPGYKCHDKHNGKKQRVSRQDFCVE